VAENQNAPVFNPQNDVAINENDDIIGLSC